jgi:thiol:disulfide interchange protein DsbD
MKRLSLAASFAAIVLAAPLFAQFDGGGITSDTAKSLVALSTEGVRVDGGALRGTLVATIKSGWHINSATPLDSFAIPTTIKFDPAVADLVSAAFPPHELKSFAFSGSGKLAVYEGTIRVPFVATLKGAATHAVATLRYQSCNDKICLPPASITIDVQPGVAPVAGGAAAPPSAASSSSQFTPLSAAPRNSSALFGNDIGSTFTSHGLPLTLVAIFILGLALNLTPCVYPLIPITVGFFAGQTGGRRSQRAALSSVYVLGIAITYSILGVFSALSGRLFGAWLQLPAVLIFFALLMLIMASSMFGLFEMQAPRFITNRSGGRAGLAGALGMGLLIGIVAAPCVGPFVISLIALVAQLASPLMGFLLFFVLALGLGLPYLLLGIFSSGLTAIPRSGMWMVQVKKAMGFILIAMAFYFLRPLIGESIFRWGVAGSLLVGALMLFLSRTTGGRVMRLACASLLLVAGVAFALPTEGGSSVSWKPFRESSLTSSSGRPVIVDFYADWCIPCKELDQKTFRDGRVSDELARFERFKGNLTSSDDPTAQAMTRKYSIVGVPTILLIGSDGREVTSLRLTGFEEPEKFLARLRQVR